mgnify:CR=1 FL=1
MSILVNSDSRVIFQGFTGQHASFLGKEHDPLLITEDPNSELFSWIHFYGTIWITFPSCWRAFHDRRPRLLVQGQAQAVVERGRQLVPRHQQVTRQRAASSGSSNRKWPGPGSRNRVTSVGIPASSHAGMS